MAFGRNRLGPGASLLSAFFELLGLSIVIARGPEWTEAVWLHDITIFQPGLPHYGAICILTMDAIGVEEDALPASLSKKYVRLKLDDNQNKIQIQIHIPLVIRISAG